MNFPILFDNSINSASYAFKSITSTIKNGGIILGRTVNILALRVLYGALRVFRQLAHALSNGASYGFGKVMSLARFTIITCQHIYHASLNSLLNLISLLQNLVNYIFTVFR